jgi:hypothetical protein
MLVKEASRGWTPLCKELQQIPPDIGPSARKKGKSLAVVVDDTNLGAYQLVCI